MPDGDQKIIDEAVRCLQLGFFQGTLARCDRVRALRGDNLVRFLALVHSGGAARSQAARMTGSVDHLRRLHGGLGMPELAVVAAHLGRLDVARDGIEALLGVVASQNGVLLSYTPAPLLELAELSLDAFERPDLAVSLLNVALGHCAVFASSPDVERLGRLLVRLGAPFPLWGDWAAIFLRHVSFAHWRVGACAAELPDACEWAAEQDAGTERVMLEVVGTAPRGTADVLAGLAPHFQLKALPDIIKNKCACLGAELSPRVPDSLWIDIRNVRGRCFWFEMIAQHEQDFVRNGEWALFCTPTSDFSMGLAQWWRALESVLKRSVRDELSQLFAANPHWADWDKQNLSEKRREKEGVFLRLADPKDASRLTLYDLLFVLLKCSEPKPDGSGSMLRREATRFLARYQRQVRTLTTADFLRPRFLTPANIDLFRNRASHDDPIDRVAATMGRVLAKGALDTFFYPALEGRGFKPALMAPDAG